MTNSMPPDSHAGIRFSAYGPTRLISVKTYALEESFECRPPENRDPLPNEWDACIPYLREQFRLIKPKIVVCLGRIAAQRIIRPDYSVMKEHGQLVEKNGVYFTATLHPAALLRSPGNKPLSFADYVAIREKIEAVCTHTYD